MSIPSLTQEPAKPSTANKKTIVLKHTKAIEAIMKNVATGGSYQGCFLCSVYQWGFHSESQNNHCRETQIVYVKHQPVQINWPRYVAYIWHQLIQTGCILGRCTWTNEKQTVISIEAIASSIAASIKTHTSIPSRHIRTVYTPYKLLSPKREKPCMVNPINTSFEPKKNTQQKLDPKPYIPQTLHISSS